MSSIVMQGYSKAANTKPLPGIYKVGEVLGLDGVRSFIVYSTTQYYNTIVIKCIQYKYKHVRFVAGG